MIRHADGTPSPQSGFASEPIDTDFGGHNSWNGGPRPVAEPPRPYQNPAQPI
jgi:hypothetical protein